MTRRRMSRDVMALGTMDERAGTGTAAVSKRPLLAGLWWSFGPTDPFSGEALGSGEIARLGAWLPPPLDAEVRADLETDVGGKIDAAYLASCFCWTSAVSTRVYMPAC